MTYMRLHRRYGRVSVLELVTETTGVSAALVQVAVAYWAAYPAEIDALIDRAEREETDVRRRWEREHDLLTT